MQIFSAAPKTSFAYKIYLKRNEKNPCYLLDQKAKFGHLMASGILQNSFVMIADIASEIGVKLLQALAKQSTYTNLDPVIESVRTLVFNKRLNKNVKKFFDFALSLYSEVGIFQKGVDGYANYLKYLVSLFCNNLITIW